MAFSNNEKTFKASPRPPFPQVGSTTSDGKYFSLGKLGHGTFCEISKCVDLSYHHTIPETTKSSNESTHQGLNGNLHQQVPQPQQQRQQQCQSSSRRSKRLRICAAKIEHSTFSNSGLLDGEASVLRYLSNNMNNQTPVFCDYIIPTKGEKGVKTLVMEFLPGEDMHQLIDRHSQISARKKASKMSQPANLDYKKYKRLKIKDAVYLCADVILPLLRSMHDCGMIHRDVKPSNCVRTGASARDTTFKLVDFGLSKNFVVPEDSPDGDTNHQWTKSWHGQVGDAKGYIRKERDSAEFRGTSMYAGLRIHQGYDHCRRDDIWGLMYVFCDMVTGGLPWMAYATNKNRAMCQRMKEWIHGERLSIDKNDIGNSNGHKEVNMGKKKITSDRIEELLKGVNYHLGKYEIEEKNPNRLDDQQKVQHMLKLKVLKMSKDEKKINALRKAFDHLAMLTYFDEPNYDHIHSCLMEFSACDGDSEDVKAEDDCIVSLYWKQPTQKEMEKRKWERLGKRALSEKKVTEVFSFDQSEYSDPLTSSMLNDANSAHQLLLAQQGNENMNGNGNNGASSFSENFDSKDSPNYNEIEDIKRLPLQLQFHLAQVEYNAMNSSTIPTYLAFRDWTKLASTLAFDDWDIAKYERGDHRSPNDGFKRLLLTRLIQQCLDAAKPFRNFCKKECFYILDESAQNVVKKRMLCAFEDDEGRDNCELIQYSKLICALRSIIENEKERQTAPPPKFLF